MDNYRFNMIKSFQAIAWAAIKRGPITKNGGRLNSAKPLAKGSCWEQIEKEQWHWFIVVSNVVTASAAFLFGARQGSKFWCQKGTTTWGDRLKEKNIWNDWASALERGRFKGNEGDWTWTNLIHAGWRLVIGAHALPSSHQMRPPSMLNERWRERACKEPLPVSVGFPSYS